ncbi:MAG: ion channel [Terriglobales bacterium]
MALNSGQPALPESTDQKDRDLGFGSVLSSQRQLRLLNRDGSFNVYRGRPTWWRRLASYHVLLTLSWPWFFTFVAATFVAVNAVFACVYYLLGPESVQGSVGVNNPYLRCFFFSVDTFATIGYGNLSPAGVPANAIVSIESLFGLMMFAIATGLVFARFSRPVANIIYSRHAIVAPYNDIRAFEFRIINGRDNELIDVEARVVLTRFEDDADGIPQRRYFPLRLERDRVAFFPLAWTIVHPIDNSSPLHGASREDLIASRAEFLILLTATEEAFSQTVQSRSSYVAEEIVWGARFTSLFQGKDNALSIDMHRFNSFEPAELP